MFPDAVQKIISTYYIFDIIPLDLFLHFCVGMIWTIMGIKFHFSFKSVFFGLIMIAAFKELNDYSINNPASWKEYLSDFLVSLLYISLLYIVRVIKRNDRRTTLVQNKKWDIYK